MLNASIWSFVQLFQKSISPEDVFVENLERGLAEPLKTHKTVEMRHDVLRKVLKRPVLNLNAKIWPTEADFDRRYLPEGWHSTYPTKRGDQLTIIFPIVVRLFLDQSWGKTCKFKPITNEQAYVRLFLFFFFNLDTHITYNTN